MSGTPPGVDHLPRNQSDGKNFLASRVITNQVAFENFPRAMLNQSILGFYPRNELMIPHLAGQNLAQNPFVVTISRFAGRWRHCDESQHD